MQSRGVPAIALKPANQQGGNYFMSLLAGKRLHAYKWTEFPIPDEVITRVHEMAEEEGQKELVNETPLFEWNIGNEITYYKENINEPEAYELYDMGESTSVLNNEKDEENHDAPAPQHLHNPESNVLADEFSDRETQSYEDAEREMDDIFCQAEQQLDEKLAEIQNDNDFRNLNEQQYNDQGANVHENNDTGIKVETQMKILK